MSVGSSLPELHHLYTTEGLREIHKRFLYFCALSGDLLVDAISAQKFIIDLFGIHGEFHSLCKEVKLGASLHSCKRLFLERIVLKEHVKTSDFLSVKREMEILLGKSTFDDVDFADAVLHWLSDKELYKSHIDLAAQYALHKIEEGGSALFSVPKKLDFHNLIELNRVSRDGLRILEKQRFYSRDGFDLSDDGLTPQVAIDHANYCIICHVRGRDSCRKGLQLSDGVFKSSPLGIKLKGCPLRQKISEMNKLYAQGDVIAALVVITLDNPMCAATGHRICNNCMRSCIYQKQEPVNVPGVETKILDLVLGLPYGFEIYSLLTRWNPLRQLNPYPKASSGRKVLIAGSGPSGFTLAHYLLNEGHTVICVDGVKIEPLDRFASSSELIKDVSVLYERLSNRKIYGFGGVAEYGITVRWNKNYLKLIRILLERRANFRLVGGAKFGSNITFDDCNRLGVDYIAICTGSGSPNIPNVRNIFAKGVRFASDFLMQLQLSGAFKVNSFANLQIRMPVVVIGGGLTAVDVATEAMTYYKVQVTKLEKRYRELEKKIGSKELLLSLSPEDKKIAEEMLSHAYQMRRSVDQTYFLKQLGGVKILYRKKITDSPAYRMNFEELDSAMSEGVEFVENIELLEVLRDSFGAVEKIKCIQDEEIVVLPAKSVILAIGTKPLKVEILDFWSLDKVSMLGDLDPEYSGSVVSAMASAKDKYPEISKKLWGDEYRDFDGKECIDKVVSVQNNAISDIKERVALGLSDAGVDIDTNDSDKMSLVSIGRGENILGTSDILNTVPIVSENATLGDVSGVDSAEAFRCGRNNVDKMNHVFMNLFVKLMKSTVVKVHTISDNIFEVIIHSPLAAANFKPGQFYKLQNFETNHGSVIEPIALTGSEVDRDRGIISLIVIEIGRSSHMCRMLREGEEVVLEGPAGAPTEVLPNENVVLIGGGLGNAVLFSIAALMKSKNCNVIYFAGYRKRNDRFKESLIESNSDVVVWVCDEGALQVTRKQDISLACNMLQALQLYNEESISGLPFALSETDRLITIGSDGLMAALGCFICDNRARFKSEFKAIASVNSPMQCMMQGICGQCIQKHNVNGNEQYVYSCVNQDQNMLSVDFEFLRDRLKQNSLLERISYLDCTLFK